MDVQGKRTIPLSPEKTWEALNSTRMLKACIPGCESITQSGDGAYEVVQVLEIAGHGTRFSSTLTLEDVDPPHSYVLRFSGNGGAGGFGMGRALIALRAVDDGTQMNYHADIEVGGTLAQMSRNVTEAAIKGLIDEFFTRFEGAVRGEAGDIAPHGVIERVWFMMPPWAWAISTLIVVFIVYWGLHGTW